MSDTSKARFRPPKQAILDSLNHFPGLAVVLAETRRREPRDVLPVSRPSR